MVKCPFCHSANVEAEHDYNEVKNEIKKYANEIEDVIPQMHDLINTALSYDPYEDEEYLKRLEEKGFAYVCLDCGHAFYEYDPDKKLNPIEITKEEFEKIIYDELALYSRFGGMVLDDDTKNRLIQTLVGNRKKFYREMAYDVVEEFKTRSSELDEFVADIKMNELPS